jgi:hypothetical protein
MLTDTVLISIYTRFYCCADPLSFIEEDVKHLHVIPQTIRRENSTKESEVLSFLAAGHYARGQKGSYARALDILQQIKGKCSEYRRLRTVIACQAYSEDRSDVMKSISEAIELLENTDQENQSGNIPDEQRAALWEIIGRTKAIWGVSDWRTYLEKARDELHKANLSMQFIHYTRSVLEAETYARIHDIAQIKEALNISLPLLRKGTERYNNKFNEFTGKLGVYDWFMKQKNLY